MARRSDGEELGIYTELVLKGDWHKGEGEKVIGKPITRVHLAGWIPRGVHIVLTHSDLLTLLEGYILADELSIKLIKEGKSGNVKNFETPLVDKVQKMLDFHREIYGRR